MTVTAENIVFHKNVVIKGTKTFSALSDKLRVICHKQPELRKLICIKHGTVTGYVHELHLFISH